MPAPDPQQQPRDEGPKGSTAEALRLPGGWVNRCRAWLVPAVMVAVAATQLVRVHFDGLNSWRGGGFGMYAGFHPRHHDAWLIDTATGEAFRYEKTGKHNTGPHAELIRPILTHPSQRRVDEALASLPDGWKDLGRLEVWRPTYDTSTGRLGRRLIATSAATTPGTTKDDEPSASEAETTGGEER